MEKKENDHNKSYILQKQKMPGHINEQNITRQCWISYKIDWLEFNSTFSTNMQYRAFGTNSAV